MILLAPATTDDQHNMSKEWTKERVAALKKTEIEQLRTNANARGHADVVALCDEVLQAQPRRATPTKRTRQHELDGRPLVSRGKAFEMRGVKLHNPRWSWGGVRPTDGVVVFTVWAADIEDKGSTRRYMLFGPDRGGDRPWADTPGGKERLEHCRRALSQGGAEGLLIYGERRGRDLPLEQASKVTGADPYTVLRFRVEQQGDEYWAAWDTRATACRCCDVKTPKTGPRICPECMHIFQGHGWDGIDAHWRARHEVVMPYASFWESLCAEHRG